MKGPTDGCSYIKRPQGGTIGRILIHQQTLTDSVPCPSELVTTTEQFTEPNNPGVPHAVLRYTINLPLVNLSKRKMSKFQLPALSNMHYKQTEGRVKHKVRLGVELKGIHTHIPSGIW